VSFVAAEMVMLFKPKPTAAHAAPAPVVTAPADSHVENTAE